MYYVYILQSTSFGRYYVGSTGDIARRLLEHNSGSTHSTKPFRPWVLVYQEELATKTDARKRENQIKRYKGGRAFHQLLKRRRA